MTTYNHDPEELGKDLGELRHLLQSAADVSHLAGYEREFVETIDPSELDEDDALDEELRRQEEAEKAEIVRGRPHHEWWPDIQEMEKDHARWGELESLLIEMRDAAEESSRIAGWTVAPAPAKALASLYRDQGDLESARNVLKRHLDSLARYRKHVPEGGDRGEREIREWLEELGRG